MIKTLLSTFLFFLGCLVFQAQIVSGKIINSISSVALPDVAIVTNTNFGTTSSKSGEFKLQIKNAKNVTFSSLGFTSITLSIQELKDLNFIVPLSEKINELKEIQLNLAIISLDSLIAKTNRSMKQKFISEPSKYQFYARENTKVNFRTLDLELEKSSLLSRASKKLAEQELEDYAKSLKSSNPDISAEFYGTTIPKKIYLKKTKKYFTQNKVDSVNGYTLLKNKKNITIEQAQNDLQNIVLKHLDKEKTYRVGSGLFRIEDSLSIKTVMQEADSLQMDKTFSEFAPMFHFNDAKVRASFFRFEDEKNFFNQKYYEHTLEKNEILRNELLYVLTFNPRKSKSKYSGKIYIHPKDYTVAKIEYEYAEGKKGQSFNLKWVLGVKVSADLKKVALYYEKNAEDKVYASYFKEIKGSYAYVHRPIKFKENSPTKNKVKFDIKIELDTKETSEVLITDVLAIDESEIKKLDKEYKNKRFPYISAEDFSKSKWKNRQLIIAYLNQWK
jgi:hypothetical protein